MEAWLKTDNILFRFPLVPQQIEIDGGYRVDTDYLANGNEVSIFGGKNLKKTSLSSHFPSDKDRTYLEFYDFPDPMECVRIIDEIARSQSEIRYIVTETEINMPIKVTGFKRGIQDATADIYFTLDIIEYITPKSVRWSPLNNTGSSVNSNSNVATTKVPLNKRSDDKSAKTVGKIHTVVKGDCLWDIADKYYKDGSKYRRIRDNAENQKKYPKLKNSNVISAGWKLVIP